MKEFNNRKIADKYAEFITGKELRLYLADKVKKYAGENVTVFDGAVGSGQLEQFINCKKIYATEIQKEACDTFLSNFDNAEVENISFFNYKTDLAVDCVVMNYPFSLKFKDLSDEEKENIQEMFPWKKSGVADDIFILKSLELSKRWGFYIGFPGITYRQTESKFRKLIGDKLVELNSIENAFEDTNISVVFLVVDKTKTDKKVKKEIYDCKSKKIKYHEETLSEDERWMIPVEEIEKEEIDPVQAEIEKRNLVVNNLRQSLVIDREIAEMNEDLGIEIESFNSYVLRLKSVIDEFL